MPERPAAETVLMPLLDRITNESLDRDYQQVAERRGGPAPQRRPAGTAAAVLIVFGMLVAVAAAQTSRNAPQLDASRASLIEQVQTRKAASDKLQQKLLRLRQQNTDLAAASTANTASLDALDGRIRRVAAAAGFGSVTGPGLRIVVDDAPNADPNQAVRDEDLAILVSGLRHAGAEAISVNGRRLTAHNAFRNVGPAIHIGATPLVAPYEILVIGNQRTLAADLLASTHGQEWFTLKDTWGFRFDVHNEDSLTLPAARTPTRLLAHQPTDEDRPEKGDVS